MISPQKKTPDDFKWQQPVIPGSTGNPFVGQMPDQVRHDENNTNIYFAELGNKVFFYLHVAG